jgi:hypothetical protein
MFVVPVPGFRVDRFSDRSKDTERAEIMTLNVLGTQTTQEANSSRGRVELSEFMLGYSLPITRRSGIDGRRFKDRGGDSVEKRAIDDVGVARDPSNVGHAGEAISGVDVKDILHSQSGSE